MAEGNSSNLNSDGISPEQPVSEHPDIPPALIATRNSMWLFKSKFIRSVFVIALGLLACTAIYSLYIFTRHADPAEIFIFSAAKYSPDKPFTLLVLARDAKTELPLQNQSIDLYMGLSGKEPRKLSAVKTGADGIALIPVSPCPAGEYQIKAVLRELSAVSNIEVKQVYKSMLTSDKPMYQPGQTIHLRNLTLNAIDLHPAPENDVNFKIHDPNGNLLFDQTVKSSAYGIASADFPLADQVNTGGYKITVSEGLQQTVKSVDVKNYHLPNYKITLNTDKKFYAPGDTVTGTVNTEYIWGAPLANAKIALTASAQITKTVSEVIVDPFRAPPGRRGRGGSPQPPQNYTIDTTIQEQQILVDIKGVTDSTGRLNFKLQLPENLDITDLYRETSECKITVNVLSPTEQKEDLHETLIVTAKPLHISYIPEFGQLLAGFSSRIYLFVSDPYGDPVEAELKIGLQTLQTGKNGLALVPVSPTDKEITVNAVDRMGHKVEQKICLNYNSDQDAFLLKAGKSVINTSEELQLNIIANQPGGRIFIYLVKDETPLEFMPVTFDTKEKQLRLKIPPDISGTLQIHAYRLFSNGEVAHESRLVQVIPEKQLTVKIRPSQPQHAEAVKADFQVKDQSGQPVQAALSIVATTDSKPDGSNSEQAFFQVQEELLKPNYQDQVAVTLMQEPVDQLTAGYLLANQRDFSNLQMQSCSKYAERENSLVQPKIKFGNKLFSYSLQAALILLAILCIPLLLVALNTKNNSYRMIVRKECHGEIHRRLLKLQWMFSAITASAMFFMVLLWSDPSPVCFLKMKYELILLLVIFTLLLVKSFKDRNRIFEHCSPDSEGNLQKIILLIPWFYGVFTFTFLFLITATVFFPNTPELCFISFIFCALSFIPLFGLRGIQCSVYNQEYLDLYCNLEANNMGLGIGCYSRSFYSLWIMASGFYVGPIIMTYLIIATVIISLFLPFGRAIDRLGGSGYSRNASRAPREEFFKPVPEGRYFTLNGIAPHKEGPVSVSPYFAETLLWQPELITDENGRAAISFKFTGQSVQFRVSAITLDGAMGASRQELPSSKLRSDIK